jgi:hypothetical protein
MKPARCASLSAREADGRRATVQDYQLVDCFAAF